MLSVILCVFKDKPDHLFNALTTLLTFWYAICSIFLFSETQKLRNFYYEPNIAIMIIPNKDSLNNVDLVIENIGQGGAYEVKFETSKDIILPTGKKISEIYLFNKIINYIGPKQHLNFYIVNLAAIKNKIDDYIFEIKVNYKDVFKNIHNVKFKIDFSYLLFLPNLSNEKPFNNIVSSIDNLSCKLDKLIDVCKSFDKSIIENEKEKEKKIIEIAKNMPEKIEFKLDNESLVK